jgi:hypothetical protein
MLHNHNSWWKHLVCGLLPVCSFMYTGPKIPVSVIYILYHNLYFIDSDLFNFLISSSDPTASVQHYCFLFTFLILRQLTVQPAKW